MSMQERYLSNVLYFEGTSMRELYGSMKSWQDENGIRFRSLNIEQDHDKFCCIALIESKDFVQQIAKEEIAYYKNAMARFQRKALRIIVNEGHTGAEVDYKDDNIPLEKILAIQSKLKKCTTSMDVIAVFKEEF